MTEDGTGIVTKRIQERLPDVLVSSAPINADELPDEAIAFIDWIDGKLEGVIEVSGGDQDETRSRALELLDAVKEVCTVDKFNVRQRYRDDERRVIVEFDVTWKT